MSGLTRFEEKQILSVVGKIKNSGLEVVLINRFDRI